MGPGPHKGERRTEIPNLEEIGCDAFSAAVHQVDAGGFAGVAPGNAFSIVTENR